MYLKQMLYYIISISANARRRHGVQITEEDVKPSFLCIFLINVITPEFLMHIRN